MVASEELGCKTTNNPFENVYLVGSVPCWFMLNIL